MKTEQEVRISEFYVRVEGTTELWRTVPSCSNVVLAKAHDKIGYLAKVLNHYEIPLS